MTNRLLLFLLLFGIHSIALSQEITVEKIWKNREFSAASVDGFKSMKDGEHFTKISGKEGDLAITKHAFSDFKGNGEIIVKLADIKLNVITIDFDEASKAWRANKIPIGDGQFKYKGNLRFPL